jgi:hypothetical protein
MMDAIRIQCRPSLRTFTIAGFAPMSDRLINTLVALGILHTSPSMEVAFAIGATLRQWMPPDVHARIPPAASAAFSAPGGVDRASIAAHGENWHRRGRVASSSLLEHVST